MIEKPLGQSFEEVLALADFMADKNAHTFVNLNMRMYPFIKQLKNVEITFRKEAPIIR